MCSTRELNRSQSGFDMCVFKVLGGGGAFSLCTPSLGVLFTKPTLRFCILGRMIRAVAPPCARIQTLAGLQHYVLYGGAGLYV